MVTSLIDVPVELFDDIMSYIAPVDYLKVKLLSKDFSARTSHVFKRKEMTKAEVVRGQTSWETSLPWGRRLRHCICTHCGLVKPADKFTDNQAVKTNHKRICISCGISKNMYTTGRQPKINGEAFIPCWRCRQAVPQYHQWEQSLESAKDHLAKVLDETRSDGFRPTYSTTDGRTTLGWSRDLWVLAFCRPCLAHMMSQDQEEDADIS